MANALDGPVGIAAMLDGMCSGTVVCRRLPLARRCAAIRSLFRKISTL